MIEISSKSAKLYIDAKKIIWTLAGEDLETEGLYEIAIGTEDLVVRFSVAWKLRDSYMEKIEKARKEHTYICKLSAIKIQVSNFV